MTVIWRAIETAPVQVMSTLVPKEAAHTKTIDRKLIPIPSEITVVHPCSCVNLPRDHKGPSGVLWGPLRTIRAYWGALSRISML